MVDVENRRGNINYGGGGSMNTAAVPGCECLATWSVAAGGGAAECTLLLGTARWRRMSGAGAFPRPYKSIHPPFCNATPPPVPCHTTPCRGGVNRGPEAGKGRRGHYSLNPGQPQPDGDQLHKGAAPPFDKNRLGCARPGWGTRLLHLVGRCTWQTRLAARRAQALRRPAGEPACSCQPPTRVPARRPRAGGRPGGRAADALRRPGAGGEQSQRPVKHGWRLVTVTPRRGRHPDPRASAPAYPHMQHRRRPSAATCRWCRTSRWQAFQ
jgi:hypothetical protein